MYRALISRLFLTAPLLVAACGTASPLANASKSPAASPSASASATAAPIATASPVATNAACDTSASGKGTVGQATITDVRVASHSDYDRIVFEFGGRGGPAGVPSYEIKTAARPIMRDPSGLPLVIAGDPVFGIILRGGTKQSLEGTSTYGGATDFKTGYPMLRELAEGGDFEAIATWYAGLSKAGCVHASVLADPARLVIDLSHR